ncbi:MAG: glycosyltransferase family 4 protein, partial [Flavitalea sp.]
ETVALATELGVTSSITFQSFRLDVPDVLGAADIFVLPSLWEGLPIGLLEAMAMGKAIIASSVDGTPEVIRHDQNGLLVKPGSWEDLGDAIVRLSSDKDMIRTFQERALKTLSEEFNVNNMTLQIEDLYQKICKN